MTDNTMTIRIGKNTLSFTTTDITDADTPVSFEPYVVRSGISMAANLREALKELDLDRKARSSVKVLIEARVLMVPVERFSEDEAETLYRHAFSNADKLAVRYNVLASLNAVAVFGINKDLLLVLTDNFRDVQLTHVMMPVWSYLHQRSFTGHRNKLYAYFHDKKLDVFSFHMNRFKFCNAFDTANAHDVLYFLLNVWKQLNLQQAHDELHLLGDIPEQEWLMGELRSFLKNAYALSAATEFSSSAAARVKGMNFDLVAMLTRGK